MDGDSSTTDASQLGITGEYMASGHYVLQPQDGKKWPRKERRFSAFILKLVSLCILIDDLSLFGKIGLGF